MASNPKLKQQPQNFNGLNAEFGVLQNIRLSSKNFDGEFADLEAPAMEQAKGALRKLVEDNGYTSIKEGIRFRRNNKDIIVCALTKNTKMVEGTATSGSVTTLTLAGAAWGVNTYQNKYLKYIQDDTTRYCLITSNTADTLTIPYQSEALTTPTFEIWEPDALYTYDI